MRDYKKIVAWQRAHALTLRVYRLTREFPDHERHGITNQLRRAAASVAANIVEGSAHDNAKEYVRYLGIARASLKETEYFLLLSHDLGYISPLDFESMTQDVNRTFAALIGLMKAIRSGP